MNGTSASLQAWDVSPDQFPDRGSEEEKLHFLLRYAVLAPSGHNTQPWRFRVDGNTVELYADRAQALPVVDPDDRALVISCGAALLNLRVALRRFGYADDRIELLPDAADSDLLARVRLRAGDPLSEGDVALCDAIPERRTTRAAYADDEVPEQLREAMRRDTAAEGAWLLIVEGERRGALADLVAEGDRAQMSDKRFRRELAAWIHPNRSGTRRGMRGYGFGFGDVMSLGGPLVIRTFDIGKGQAARDRELVGHAPLLGVFGTDGDAPRDWLAVGQAMERALLRACAHGLTASYLNQPVEVEEIRPRLAELIGKADAFPQLVIRFGRGPTVEHSPRERVDDVLRVNP